MTQEKNKLQKRKQTRKAAIIAGISLWIIGSFTVYGSPVSEPKTEKQDTTTAIANAEKEFATNDFVENPPSYPGGEKACMDFFRKNLKYPKKAQKLGIQGTVFISFVVEKDGKLSDVKVVRGIGGGCDEEALRVVKKMPKWNPGKQKGETVSVKFTIPVRFRLK